MEPDNDENQVKNETERVLSAEPSNEEHKSPISVYGNEQEALPAEKCVVSEPDGENTGSVKTEEEEEEEAPAVEEDASSEFPGVDNVSTSDQQDLDVKVNEVNGEEPAVSREHSVVFEINSDDDGDNGGLVPRLHLGIPERDNNTSQNGQEGKGQAKGHEPNTADNEDIVYEEHRRLIQDLCEERDKASQHNSQLQTKLVEYFKKKSGEDFFLQPEREMFSEYEKYINVLTDLQQKNTADSNTAQQQTEELRLQAQQKLDKVESEWRALVALKRDVAVSTLSPHLGKQVAQDRVEATLAVEQLRQEQLTGERLQNIRLRMKVHRLETELRDGEERARDPLQVRFEQLQAQRMEMRKQAEKQNEEALKMQRKISSGLELLSNVKEKLFWSQSEVRAQREQLARVEAAVARQRELLSRTKRSHSGLQRDKQRLREERGMLGNRVLLQDYQDTVDASEHLEQRLGDLKGRQAELFYSCGQWKKMQDRVK